MKIHEVSQDLNEGILDSLKGAWRGMKAGFAGGAQQRAGQQFTKGIADRVFNTWNQYLVNLPPGTDPNQAIANFMDKQFHEVGPSQLQPTLSNVKDVGRARDYINKRTQEYVAQRMAAAPKPKSQLHGGYPYPTVDADITLDSGWSYGYDANSANPGWFSNHSGEKITDPASIQTLNKAYLDAKGKSFQGQGPSPDDVQGPESISIGGQKLGATDPLTTRVYNIIGGNVRQPAAASPTVSTTAPAATTTTAAPAGTTADPFAARRAAAAQAAQASMVPKKKTRTRAKVMPIRKGIAESTQLREGGNAIASSTPVKKEDVSTVVNLAKKYIPSELLNSLQTDIGSAGYKVESGDIDLMVEASEVVELFDTSKLPDPVKAAKQSLKGHFESKGIEANVNGRNVSIGVKYKEKSTGESKTAQVDVMVIHEAGLVAPWHQHGRRGMYDEPGFKGSEGFMLMSSIAKHLGLKFDPFAAKLINRETGDVVGRTRKEVAKILLGPRAKEDDLNSVRSMLAALEKDPDKEGKLAQARQDVEKGLMRLPETAPFNTAANFRKISDVVR